MITFAQRIKKNHVHGAIGISENVYSRGYIARQERQSTACPLFYKGKRHQHSAAKIWIEKNGEPCVEIAESVLSAKDNEMLVAAINRHWDFINEQITRAFNGEKTISINIEQ